MKGFDLRTFEDDVGATTELQQVSRFEIDEQQTSPWIDQQVAQGVEKQVAGEVRNRQAITFDTDEAGLAAAMRNIHRALAVDVHVTGDKEGIRPGDHLFGGVIQLKEVLRHAVEGSASGTE